MTDFIPLSGPWPLTIDRPGTYALTRDVRVPGRAITITARDVTIDLLGHTIEYDAAAGGLPEIDAAAGWQIDPDIHRLPATERPLVGSHFWQIAYGLTRSVISPPIDLPPGRAAAYFASYRPDWRFATRFILAVLDDADRTVTQINSTTEQFAPFEATAMHRYRLQLTYDGTQPPFWQPKHQYPAGSLIRPSSPTGAIYLTTTAGTSGDSEPTWIRPPRTTDTPDGTLRWSIRYEAPANFALLDLVPENVYGIFCRLSNQTAPTNLVIRNGLIHQIGRSLRGSALFLSGLRGTTLRDLDLRTRGVEASAAHCQYSTDVKIDSCTLRTASAHKFNRHQLSAAINCAPKCDHAIIKNCQITSGASWGGIYVDGQHGQIRRNTLHTQSVTTNHYAIMAYGQRHLVDQNQITADPGQGLRLDGQHNVARENQITILSVAPNWDINRLSLDAIRINDYNTAQPAKQAAHNQVLDNQITLHGKQSPLYQPAPQKLNGICNVSRGPGNLYRGNTITARTVDPEISVSGIQPGATDSLVVWQNNQIVSDHLCIDFDGYAGACHHTQFIACSFLTGPTPRDDFAVLAGAFNVKNTAFINCQVERGTLNRISGPHWSPGAEYTVQTSRTIRSTKTPPYWEISDAN